MNRTETSRVELDLDPDDIQHEYDRRHYADLSDDQLFDVAATVVSIPKRDPADSFVLHAPLELLARRALLGYVPPSEREAVRERMVWVAATYERAAESATAVEVAAFDSVEAATTALLHAIDGRDLERVDATTEWFAEHAATENVLDLAPALVDCLAAAGHASIYFSLLQRVAPRSRSALGLLRTLAHEVARMPDLRIEWIRDGVASFDVDGHTLARALASTPRLGLPGSDFIFPLVHQVDKGGVARDVIGSRLPRDADAALAPILRVAALSMLQDDPGAAPYGWSHCLTLPQAVMNEASRMADPAVGHAIAATYVVAFRAAHSRNDLDGNHAPERVSSDVIDALEAGPNVASAAAFHSSEADLARVVPVLATRAGRHEDAHLAKYTLACFDAATRDPGGRRLYLAAAVYLNAWWQQLAPVIAPA